MNRLRTFSTQMKSWQSLIDVLHNLVDSNGDQESAFVSAMLSALVEWGFNSARYYEITRDPVENNNEVLVLRAFCHANRRLKLPIGLRTPIPHSTLASSGGRTHIAFGDAENCSAKSKQWVEKLALQNDRWADIAISDHKGELYGLIAVSNDIKAHPYDADDIFYFRLIKSAVEQFQANFRLRQINLLRKSIGTFFSKTPSRAISDISIAELAVRLVLPLVGGQACAVFYYDWPTRRLNKVAQGYGSSVKVAPGEFKESYFSGQYLTGAAWEQNDLRHIPDFPRFSEHRPTLIFKESLDFHQNALGGIGSVLYDQFGQHYLRYLVRLINREENPDLPLNYSHRDSLAHACEELGEYTDEFSSRTIIKEFERVSAARVTNVADYSKRLDACVASLTALGFGAASILYLAKGSSHYELLSCKDGKLNSALKESMFEAAPNTFLTRVGKETSVNIVRLSDYQSSSGDLFLEGLQAARVVAIICACSTSDSGTILAMRCVYDPEARLSPATTLFGTKNDRDIIPTLLSVLGAAVEASRLNVSADFAEQLVAHFGHEVATPLAKLGQKAIKELNRAIKSLRDMSGSFDHIRALSLAKDQIDSQSHHISHQMKAAIALADRTSGSIHAKFEIFSWDEIVNDAWEESIDWKTGVQGRSASRDIMLETNAAITSLTSIGDANLIRTILTNLFKNAIKYSLPRFEGAPMVVRALGQPQSHVDIVQIENWGIGIPPDKRELIFNKFYRYDRVDRIRAIRGMGLGLYISRLFISVHEGQIFCRASTPTLNDPIRLANFEGYLTTFELRVPRGLPQGVQKVKIGD